MPADARRQVDRAPDAGGVDVRATVPGDEGQIDDRVDRLEPSKAAASIPHRPSRTRPSRQHRSPGCSILAIDPVPGEVRTNDRGHPAAAAACASGERPRSRAERRSRMMRFLSTSSSKESRNARARRTLSLTSSRRLSIWTTPVSVSPARNTEAPQVVRVNSHSGAAVRTTMGSDGVSSWKALMTAICRIAWPKPCPEM